MTALEFNVVGRPTPQGSKNAFVNKYTGRAQMKEQTGANLTTWRQDVKAAALNAIAVRAAGDPMGWQPYDGPVHVELQFRIARPKAHYRTGRNAHLLRDNAPYYVVSRGTGDLEKLVRSTHDALTTAGVWTDDSMVAGLYTTKVYTDSLRDVGATIRIIPLSSRLATAATPNGETASLVNTAAAPTLPPGAAAASPDSVAAPLTAGAATVQEALL